MINPATYTVEWIESLSHSLNNADETLVEKVIRALINFLRDVVNK